MPWGGSRKLLFSNTSFKAGIRELPFLMPEPAEKPSLQIVILCALQISLSWLTIPATVTSNRNRVKSRILMLFWPNRKSVSCNALSRLNGVTHISDYTCSGDKCQFTCRDNQLKRCVTYDVGIDSSPLTVFTSLILSAWEYICVCACTHVYAICACVCVCMYVCMCVCARTNVCA